MSNDDVKHFGRVYTPEKIVAQVLQPFYRSDLMDIKICDPACGSGDFLVPIAKQICRRIKTSNSQEQSKLQQTLIKLTGVDVDEDAVQLCKRRLTNVVQSILGQTIPEEHWCIVHGDSLDVCSELEGSFDWVVGNPPYVRVQHLEADRRKKIKGQKWGFYRGSGDLYFVFFELGLRLLNPEGQLAYISPSGWLRNDAGSSMRRQLKVNHELISIRDYRDYQVFPGCTTYTCISHIRKNRLKEVEPKASAWIDGRFRNAHHLDQTGDIWSISDKKPTARDHQPTLLGDVANIQVGIQTLADSVFILPVISKNKTQVICHTDAGDISLERGATKPILKASVLKNGKDRINRVVIYPYTRNGKLMAELDFASKFPNAYAWLLLNKKRLLLRDKGTFDPRKWYGFGREVGIRSGFGRKILTSGMNEHPNFQLQTNPHALFYSGYSIKPRREVNLDVSDLITVLNSKEMSRHIQEVSQPFRGGWFSYAKRYIRQFEIPRDLLNG